MGFHIICCYLCKILNQEWLIFPNRKWWLKWRFHMNSHNVKCTEMYGFYIFLDINKTDFWSLFYKKILSISTFPSLYSLPCWSKPVRLSFFCPNNIRASWLSLYGWKGRDVFQNIFFCAPQKKESHNIRVSKWWQNFHFWVNYSFNLVK